MCWPCKWCSLGHLAVLVGVASVLHRVASLFWGPIFDAGQKPLVVHNALLREYLETSTGWGRIAGHPRYAELPVKGVYMFQYMGPIALVDFSHLTNWNIQSGTFDLDMSWCLLQSGVPRSQGGTLGPFVPGGFLLRILEPGSRWQRFHCPPLPMRDGQNCTVVTGKPFGSPEETDWGVTQWFIRREGGRLWVRDTTMFRRGFLLHHYNLLRVVDENGTIDEDNFALLVDKLRGQDLFYVRPELGMGNKSS